MLLDFTCYTAFDTHTPDEPLEVSVDEAPIELRNSLPSVDIPAYYRRPNGVVVLQDGEHRGIRYQRAGATPALATLEHVPPEVGAAGGARDDVQLLTPVLTHVGDVDQVGSGIEGDTPRVPEAVHVHLLP